MPVAFFCIVPAPLPALAPLLSSPPAALAAGAANPSPTATIPQKTIDARPGRPVSADEREAVMIWSFRFEGGAQKTLERLNLFASGRSLKSRRIRHFSPNSRLRPDLR